ncbi:hypothetical protein KCU81_g9175, partial [Aureobasidium melanogenum]|uniref:Uncharacterized protein n=1 Tax=Aureobasidium melanogenum (strain CBS 110374) TaxID=1043003 RepID=A0A074WQH9_AURM1
MGHRLSKVARKNRTKCQFCSSGRPPSYKDIEHSEKAPVEKYDKTSIKQNEKPSVKQITYQEGIFEHHPDAHLLFGSTMRKMKLATDDLEIARRLITGLENRDVKTLYDALEDAHFIQGTENITAIEVDMESRESKEDLELLVSIEFDYDSDKRKEIILTRYGHDTIASTRGSY